jgi:hypothetical protein
MMLIILKKYATSVKVLKEVALQRFEKEHRKMGFPHAISVKVQKEIALQCFEEGARGKQGVSSHGI